MSEIKVDLKEGQVGVYIAYLKGGHLYTATDEHYTLETIKNIDTEKLDFALKTSLNLK